MTDHDFWLIIPSHSLPPSWPAAYEGREQLRILSKTELPFQFSFLSCFSLTFVRKIALECYFNCRKKHGVMCKNSCHDDIDIISGKQDWSLLNRGSVQILAVHTGWLEFMWNNHVKRISLNVQCIVVVDILWGCMLLARSDIIQVWNPPTQLRETAICCAGQRVAIWMGEEHGG